jgi:hypothetical protein
MFISLSVTYFEGISDGFLKITRDTPSFKTTADPITLVFSAILTNPSEKLKSLFVLSCSQTHVVISSLDKNNYLLVKDLRSRLVRNVKTPIHEPFQQDGRLFGILSRVWLYA